MSDILDTIDGALADWTTSGDAMRWSPEPGTMSQRTPPTAALHFVIIDETHAFTQAMREMIKSLARLLRAADRARASLAQLEQALDGQTARRSAMRAAYRAKTRRRRR